jgi:hypothetical protein
MPISSSFEHMAELTGEPAEQIAGAKLAAE